MIPKLPIIMAGALALSAVYCWNLSNELNETSAKLAIERSANSALIEKINAAAEIDKKHTEDLKNALTENNRLADAVRDGTKRVYVKSVCPAGSTTTAAVDNAGRAELDRDARQNLLRLREQLIIVQKQNEALKDYVRDVCLK